MFEEVQVLPLLPCLVDGVAGLEFTLAPRSLVPADKGSCSPKTSKDVQLLLRFVKDNLLDKPGRFDGKRFLKQSIHPYRFPPVMLIFQHHNTAFYRLFIHWKRQRILFFMLILYEHRFSRGYNRHSDITFNRQWDATETSG